MSDFKINSIATKQGQHGPVIAGVSTVNSTGCMKIPSGPTAFRTNDPLGRGRAVFGGGYGSSSPYPNLNTLDMVNITTTGNAVDYGDLDVLTGYPGGLSSSTSCLLYTSPSPRD